LIFRLFYSIILHELLPVLPCLLVLLILALEALIKDGKSLRKGREDHALASNGPRAAILTQTGTRTGPTVRVRDT
jgi:hypothetical protein